MGAGTNPAMIAAFFAGFFLGASLIMAIGAQNAFVMRQGVLGNHIFWICLFCAGSDALLIGAGVYGLGTLITKIPWLLPVMSYGGAAFLITYGCLALYRAVYPQRLTESQVPRLSLMAALSICAAFTFLNPHVYLDTVILVGSIANSRGDGQEWSFAGGAALASFVWFFSLGYGSRAMRRLLSRPQVWRFLDLSIAVIMFTIASRLLFA